MADMVSFNDSSSNSFDARYSAIEDDFVALRHAGAEAPSIGLFEELEPDRLAGVDWLAESGEELDQPVRIIVAQLLNDREAGDAIGG